MKIDLNRVSVRFQGRPVLTDVTLSLTQRRIGIIGENGSGKTTLARLLNGLLIPDEGTVEVNGVDTRDDAKAVRRQVGFLFQNPDNQIVMPTVSEDIALGLKSLSLDAKLVRERVSNILDRFGLTELADRSAHVLSGGEKQMVALAGAMITEPDILVCDEPTTLLDLRNARRFSKAISDLPCAVITISHNVEQLASYDRVLVLSDRRVVRDAPPNQAIPFYMETLS